MTADSLDPRRYRRALASLRGLALGDALGSQFFVPVNHPALDGGLPPGPWRWTDDTEMACSVLAVLAEHGRVDQDALVGSFAEHHDCDRDYGPAVDRMLRLICQEGGDWRTLSAEVFNGQGSWGNGAAMRVAPLGAWYAGDAEQAAHQAEISAYTTHQHREAVAGAMGVAAAAVLVADPEGAPGTPSDLLGAVIGLLPRSAVQAGVRRVRDMLDYADVPTVAAVLGCGRRTSAHDTVPFPLWAAARNLGDYRQAFWDTARAGGDVDTTCAARAPGHTLSATPPGDLAHPVGAPPDAAVCGRMRADPAADLGGRGGAVARLRHRTDSWRQATRPREHEDRPGVSAEPFRGCREVLTATTGCTGAPYRPSLGPGGGAGV